MTTGKGQEAPHTRRGQGARIVEKLTVRAYGAATWLVAHAPGGIARWVIGTIAQAGYLFWPAKRGWSNANFSRVLRQSTRGRRRCMRQSSTADGN